VTDLAAGAAVARRIREAAGFAFLGLQSFGDHVQHTFDPAASGVWQADNASAFLRALTEAVEGEGMPCPIASGSGTGAYEEDFGGHDVSDDERGRREPFR